MPTNDLAALSEAATKGANPMLLECVENGVWQIRLVFGEGDDACHAMRQWADAYRSGDLVLIEREGMREAVDSLSGVKAWLQRWAAHVGNCRGDHACTCGLKRAKYDLDFADAAIAAILGEHP